MARRSPKRKKPKVAKYELVSKETQEGKAVHAILLDRVRARHAELRDADIVLAWMVGQRRDRDGRLILGKMKKASELDRQLHKHDLVLMLNREQWSVFTEKQRAALVDHELYHADLKIDENGDPVEDAHGKKEYRMRRHDVEEFAAVVRDHGMYKADLETFAQAMDDGRQKAMFAAGEGKKPEKSKGPTRFQPTAAPPPPIH